MQETLVVNMFGGPNAGKSTLAPGVFYELKRRNYKAELSLEYAKIMGYEERFNVLRDQLYLLDKQNRSLVRLSKNVDIVMTDSPLLLGTVYTSQDYFPSFNPLVDEIFNSYWNLNFLLQPRDILYQEFGRFQTKSEAIQKHKEIKEMLENKGIEYTEIDISANNEDAKHLVLNKVIDTFEKGRKASKATLAV